MYRLRPLLHIFRIHYYCRPHLCTGAARLANRMESRIRMEEHIKSRQAPKPHEGWMR